MVYRGLKERRYWGSSSKTWVVTESHLADFVLASLVFTGQTLTRGARESLAHKTTASWLSHFWLCSFNSSEAGDMGVWEQDQARSVPWISCTTKVKYK